MAHIQYGDIGTNLVLTVYRADGETIESQLGSASLLRILLKPEEGAVKIKTASLVTNGSDGKMKYTTASGDIDEVSTWHIQGYIELGTGKWYTTTKPFDVLANVGAVS